MKHETLRSRAWVGCVASVVASLIAGAGCRQTPNGPDEPGSAGNGGGGNESTDDRAGAPHDAGRDGLGAGGVSPVGHSDDGGANGELGEGTAGAGDSSGEAGSGADDELRREVETCLADLVGPAADDIVSARGRAGALGSVDYTIAGYSAGAHGPDGLQRGGLEDNGVRATGGYSYQCPEADIDVRGCFRYIK